MPNKYAKSLTDEVIDVIATQDKSIDSIARQSGVGASTIRGWLNNGKTPTLQNAQWVLKTLGYTITIEKESEKEINV